VSWFAESANEAEADKEHVLMFLAVDFDFPSGHARFWSGLGDLFIDGIEYLGVGELGKVGTTGEGIGLNARRKTYQCSGVDPTWVTESDIENSYGRAVVEYFGFLNSVTRALVETPEVNWEGRIDTIRRVRGSEPLIEINAEHRMVLLEQQDGWRYTHEHQQQFYSGDTGFNQVAAIALKKVLWGGRLVDPAVRDPAQRPGDRPRGPRGRK
jgi:hypothetical protein